MSLPLCSSGIKRVANRTNLALLRQLIRLPTVLTVSVYSADRTNTSPYRSTLLSAHTHTPYIILRLQWFPSRSPKSPLATAQIIWRLLAALCRHYWRLAVFRIFHVCVVHDDVLVADGNWQCWTSYKEASSL